MFAVCSGLLLVPFVVPPARFWVGGSKLSGDWRPTLLAAGLLLVYLVVIVVPPLRTFFSLTALHPIDYLVIGAAALIWSIIQRWIWRGNLLERFLHLSKGFQILFVDFRLMAITRHLLNPLLLLLNQILSLFDVLVCLL